jgi:MFS family permease
MGAILGPLAVSIFLFFNLQVKYIFLFFFLMVVLVTVLFFRFCANVKSISLSTPEESLIENAKKIKPVSYSVLLKNKIILLSCTGLFLYIGIFTILSTWLTAYFSDFDIPLYLSSAFLSAFWIFNAAGIMISGRILKKISEAKLLLFCGIAGCAGTLFYGFSSAIAAKLAFLVLQALSYSSFFPLLNAVAVAEDKKYSGTILSITLSASVIGLVFFQPVSGFIMEYFKIQGINILLIVVSIANLAVIFSLFRARNKKSLK